MIIQNVATKAISGIKWNGVATGTRILVQLTSLTILARLLVPGDFGLMSMAVAVTGFAQAFADFGLSNAIIYRQDATDEQLSSLYWLNLIVGFGITILIWFSIPLIITYYQEPRLDTVLRWSAFAFLITPIGQQFDSLLQRELRFKTKSLTQMTGNISYMFSSTLFAVLGFGVMSLVWGTLSRVIVTNGVLVVVALRSGWLPRLHFRLIDLKGFVQFGLFQMGERVLRHLAYNLDYLIIGRYLGPEPLGYYTLAYNLMRLPVQYINPVVVSVAFPSFARLQARDDLLRAGYDKLLHYLGVAILPIMAGMTITASLFVPVFFGEDWLPTAQLVRIFAVLGAWQGLGNPIGSLLLAKGRADLGFYVNLFKIFALSICVLVGVRGGIVGVAVGVLVANSLSVPILFYLQWHLIRFEPKQWLGAIKNPLIASLALTAIGASLGFTLSKAEIGRISSLIAVVVVGVIVYGGFLWFWDRQLLFEAWAETFGKS